MALPALGPALPEIILAIGAIAMVLFGAIQRERAARVLEGVALILLVVALVLVLSGEGKLTTFNGGFVADGFARFMKVLTLIGAGAAILLASAPLRRDGVMRFEFPVLVVLAAIGMMIGSGYLISSTAVTAAIVIMVLSLRRVENLIRLRQARDFRFTADDRREIRERVVMIIGQYEENIRRFSILRGDAPGRILITFRFAGHSAERRELLRTLYSVEGLHRSEEG